MAYECIINSFQTLLSMKESLTQYLIEFYFNILTSRKFFFKKGIVQSLIQKGHKIGCLSQGGSIVQGIERTLEKELWANSDNRKGGLTDGF